MGGETGIGRGSALGHSGGTVSDGEGCADVGNGSDGKFSMNFCKSDCDLNIDGISVLGGYEAVETGSGREGNDFWGRDD